MPSASSSAIANLKETGTLTDALAQEITRVLSGGG
jgi:hypothetical protein